LKSNAQKRHQKNNIINVSGFNLYPSQGLGSSASKKSRKLSSRINCWGDRKPLSRREI